MRNLTQTLTLPGYFTRPFASIAQKAVAAFQQLSASVIMPGLSEPFFGPELANPANWIAGSGTVISSGIATSTGVASGINIIQQDGLGVTSELVKVTCTITVSSGGVAFRPGGVSGSTITESGTYTQVIQAGAFDTFRIIAGASGFTGTIDLATTSVKVAVSYISTTPALPYRTFLDSTGIDILDSVSQMDQQVGRVIDARGSYDSELVTNGDFTSSVGWGVSADPGGSVTFTGGVATLTNTTGTARLAQTLVYVVGHTYEITWTQTGSNSAVYTGSSESVGSFSPGRNRRIFIATASSDQIGFRNFTAGTSYTIDDVSIKRISGSHAIQATTSNKPFARRGIVNKQLWSNTFSNAAWTKFNVTLSTTDTGPQAGTIATKIIPSSTVTPKYILQNIDFVAGTTVTIATVLKADGLRYAQLTIPAAVSSTSQYANYDLQDGVVTFSALGTATIAPAGNGYFIITWTSAVTITANSALGAYVAINGPTAARVPSFASDGTSGVYLYSTALFVGSVTASEIFSSGGIPITTTSAASSLIGKQHFEFDGVNDLLSYGVSTINNTSDHWATASFELALFSTTATSQSIYGNSSTSGTTPLTCQIFVEGANGTANANAIGVVWRSDASTLVAIYGPVVSVNQRAVVTAARIGNMGYLWFNGVLVGSQSLASVGTTTVNTSAIGALVRTTTGNYFNGDIYHLSFGQSTLTESNRAKIEAFAANQAGITL